MFEKPLGLRENPFLAGHNPKYLFPSREHQEALAHLRYGIQNREPFVLITGEVGTGKTTAVYDALAEWGSRALVALITNSALTRAELLEEICLRFGVAVTAPLSKPQALVELQRQLSEVRGRGELAILLVDEAQNLDRELLEEIRLLSNLEVSGEYLLQIFLVGQPELESKLAQKELRQLRQRIGIHYRILPLSSTETARYIHHRVSVAGGNAEELFPADTCVEIFRVTNGIPREINIVAGQSLLNAFVEDCGSVSIEHVRAVEREIEFQSVLRHQADVGAAPAAQAPAAAPAPAPAAAPPQPARPAAPAGGGATILPLSPPHAAAPPPPPHAAPPAAAEFVEGGSLADSEVEVSESAFGEALPGADDALVDEFPIADAERRSGYTRDVSAAPAPPSNELVLPSWIDEIVSRRQAMEERALAGAKPATPPAPTLPPPLTVVETGGGQGHPPASHPSPALVVAPPPERTAPHPKEPIPIFDRGGDSAAHLPPRLRHKLGEGGEEESGEKRRPSLMLPIASIVIVAIAITVLLLVRFGPWSSARRDVVPAGLPAPGTTRDSVIGAETPFPPFEDLGTSGNGPASTTVPIPRGPSDGATPSGGAPPVGSGPARPGGVPATGAGPPPADAATASPVSLPSYGIAVGTYLNEGRANAERTRLGENTQLVARVVTVAEDTVSMYRVVVGSFGDRISAERAASDLVQRGLVTEARVIAQSAGPKP
jgi:type II secretory pathway predicted ATPase ExeA